MASIYSVLMFEVHNSSGLDLVELDPNFIWVMRDIDAFAPGPAATAQLSVVDVVTGGTILLFQNDPIGPVGQSFQWQGRQVFAPPPDGYTLELLSGSAGGGGWDVRISGYRLTPP